MRRLTHRIFFFFNDTATTEIYTLSLHDALPISPRPRPRAFLYESALLRGMHRRSQGAPYPWLAEESQRRHPHRDAQTAPARRFASESWRLAPLRLSPVMASARRFL